MRARWRASESSWSRNSGGLRALRGAIDAALDAERSGTTLKETTMFDGFDHGEYEDEARERWGHTEAYRESTRRAANYGEAEWSTIHAEADQIVRDFAALMAAGEPADGERARAVAERHRQQISKWFYQCPPAMHHGLGQMYVADERFARNYDRIADGLARYVRDAMVANADAVRAATR